MESTLTRLAERRCASGPVAEKVSASSAKLGVKMTIVMVMMIMVTMVIVVVVVVVVGHPWPGYRGVLFTSV